MPTPWRPKAPPVTPEAIARSDAAARQAWDAVYALYLALIPRHPDWAWPARVPDPADAPEHERRRVSRYWYLVDAAVARQDVVRAMWA